MARARAKPIDQTWHLCHFKKVSQCNSQWVRLHTGRPRIERDLRSSLDHDGRLFRLVFPRLDRSKLPCGLPRPRWISSTNARFIRPLDHFRLSLRSSFLFFFLQWKFFLFLFSLPLFLSLSFFSFILIQYVDILIVRNRWIKF